MDSISTFIKNKYTVPPLEVSKYTNSAVVKCKTDKDVIRGLTCNNSTLNGRAINIERIPKSG